MTKISKKTIECEPKRQKSNSLDTLAQLRQKGLKASNSAASVISKVSQDKESKPNAANEDESLNNFIKRQRSKYISNAMSMALINVGSPLEKSYRNTYYCNSELMQDGDIVRAKYCNNRWCVQCNRIRIAKFIKGYSMPLMSLPDLHFMTLTCPNYVHPKRGINEMYGKIRGISEEVRRKHKGYKMQGIRKFESTLSKRGDYNMHYHFLMNDFDTCHLVKDLWLKSFPKAHEDAQDIRKADEGSLMEVFKYAAKGMTKKGQFQAKRLDKLYQAMYGKRVVQSFGIKKDVREDVSGIEAQTINFKEKQLMRWMWHNDLRDWMNDEGELFTGYILKGKLDEIIKNI